jgi:hypothetical protein
VLDRASLSVSDFDLTCSFRQGGTGQKEICCGNGSIDLECEWRGIIDWNYCRADAFLSNCILFDFDYWRGVRFVKSLHSGQMLNVLGPKQKSDITVDFVTVLIFVLTVVEG